MPKFVDRLMDRYYPKGSDGIRFRDGTVPFYNWMLANLEGGSSVLNVGAGPTPPEPMRHVRGKVAKLVGVDPDPVVLTNRDLDEAFVNNGTELPFQRATFDAVYADWTLEHVSEPGPFLAEVHRVLKPGGSFWFRTTNRNHYVNTVSALTPQWFHVLVANRARGLDRTTHEPWPTRYRMNRRPVLTRHLRGAGFESVEIRMIESLPSYMVFNPMAFLVGVGYERLVNRFDGLRPLRQIIVGRARR